MGNINNILIYNTWASGTTGIYIDCDDGTTITSNRAEKGEHAKISKSEDLVRLAYSEGNKINEDTKICIVSEATPLDGEELLKRSREIVANPSEYCDFVTSAAKPDMDALYSISVGDDDGYSDTTYSRDVYDDIKGLKMDLPKLDAAKPEEISLPYSVEKNPDAYSIAKAEPTKESSMKFSGDVAKFMNEADETSAECEDSMTF